MKKGSRASRAGNIHQNQAAAMRLRIEQVIRSIPRGKVLTYGEVARAAGFPGAARQVVAILRRSFGLPWQRVLGACGQIKLQGDAAVEQRLRLEAEGVHFRGRRVDMKAHDFRASYQQSKHRRQSRLTSKKSKSDPASSFLRSQLH